VHSVQMTREPSVLAWPIGLILKLTDFQRAIDLPVPFSFHIWPFEFLAEFGFDCSPLIKKLFKMASCIRI